MHFAMHSAGERRSNEPKPRSHESIDPGYNFDSA